MLQLGVVREVCWIIAQQGSRGFCLFLFKRLLSTATTNDPVKRHLTVVKTESMYSAIESLKHSQEEVHVTGPDKNESSRG